MSLSGCALSEEMGFMFTAAQAFEIATGYYQEGQIGPAKQLFQYVLQLDPDHAGALSLLRRIALERGERHQASAFQENASCGRGRQPVGVRATVHPGNLALEEAHIGTGMP